MRLSEAGVGGKEEVGGGCTGTVAGTPEARARAPVSCAGRQGRLGAAQARGARGRGGGARGRAGRVAARGEGGAGGLAAAAI